MRENEAYMSSLQAKVTALKSQFTELVLGDGGLTSFVKLLVDAGTTVLKFANSDVGQLIIQLGLVTALTPSLVKGFTSTLTTFSNLKTNIISSAQALATYMLVQKGYSVSVATATASNMTFVSSLKLLSTTWATTPFGMITIAAGSVMLLAKAFDALDVSTEEALQSMSDYSSQYNSASQEAQNLETQLKEINDRITEIQSNGPIQLTDQQELTNLQAQSEELSRQLRLQEQMAEANRKEAEESAKDALKGGWGEVTLEENLESYSMMLQKNRDAIDELNKKYDEGKISAKSYEDQLEALEHAQTNIVSTGGEYADQLLEIADSLTSTDEETLSLKNGVEDLVDSWLELNGQLEDNTEVQEENNEATNNSLRYKESLSNKVQDVIDSSNSLQQSYEKEAEALGLVDEQVESYVDLMEDSENIYSDLGSGISEISNAYNVLTDAISEYNSNGKLSIDTLTSLLSLEPQYLSALVNENGQLSLNEQTLYNLAEQQKTNAIIALQHAAAVDIEKLATGNLSDLSITAQGAIASMGDAASEAGNKAVDAASQVNVLNRELLVLSSSLTGTAMGNEVEGFKEKADAIRETYVNIGKELSNISIDFSSAKSSSSAKKAGGSAGKKAGDAYKEAYEKELDELDHELAMNMISEKEYYDKLEELNERYFGEASGQHEKYLDEYRKNEEKIFKWRKEQLKDDYETTRDYIDKLYDAELDALEEQYNSEKEYYDNKIDKLEEAKDKRLESINEEKEALEDLRDTELEALDEQIEKLEEQQEQEQNNLNIELNSLEAQKDELEQYWDEKINSIEKANDELDKQIKLEQLQEQLANARNQKVKVFKDGRFQFVQDESAVEEAEQNLADYQEELRREQEIQALEDQRDKELAIAQERIDNLEKYLEERNNYYEQEIESLEEQQEAREEYYEHEIELLEEQYDKIEEYYDKRIERYEEYLEELEEEYNQEKEAIEKAQEQFNDAVDEYQNTEERLTANRIANINLEKTNWKTRLNNLAEFVSEYNRLQNELDSGDEEVESHYQGKDAVGELPTYAKGTSSVGDNEIAVVGENPNREIVIGSSLNKNGTLMKLKKGSGVVNSSATETLARNLNNLARYQNLNSYNNNNYSKSSSNNSNVQQFYFGELVLPNVSNANDFVTEISNNYKNYIIQSVGAR